MTNDLRAAAERVRRVEAGDDPVVVYGTLTEDLGWNSHDEAESLASDKHSEDIETIVDAYLASHPPDGETEIDEAWLREVGFRDDDDGGYLWINSASQDFDLQYWHSTEGFCFANERGDIEVAITTRSDLRRLCAALGISLKEEKEA